MGKCKSDRWLKVDVTAAAELMDAMANFMEEIGADGVSQEAMFAPFPEAGGGNRRETLTAWLPWGRKEAGLAALETYLEGLKSLFPELDKATFNAKEAAPADWAEEWKKHFRPLRIGERLIVKPTWESCAAAAHDIVIEMDPGMAFGTGGHHSTAMCLEAMENLFLHNDAAGRHFLDVGTGTGILGIAAAKLGAEEAVCLDIDEKAVETAAGNALLNRVDGKLKIVKGEIFSLKGQFNLIAANLTSKLLIEIAGELERLTAPGGFLVLSGIIEQDRQEIENRFLKPPFSLRHKMKREEWLCYVLDREITVDPVEL